MSDLTSVTNKLLNEYNIKFNENYNDIIQLNSTIQNKEQIINMPETITIGVSQTFNDISSLFVSAVDTLNISITGILNDK